MRLEKLAAIAEIVSSIAIVLTLAYLAIQTGQSTNALYANSRATTMMADVTLQMGMLEYPELTSRMVVSPVAAADGPVGASNLLITFLRIREFAWFQYQSGILDESAFSSYMAPVPGVLLSELGQLYWPNLKSGFDPEFAARVDSMLAESAP
jgi:hypothetical protein